LRVLAAKEISMRIAAVLTAALFSLPALADAPAPERDAIVASNTAFAADLYGSLKKDGNLFFSPYSISTALAMTSAGARGKTLEEMNKVLHFGKDPEAVHKGFSLLQKDLVADPKSPFELAIANRLFAQNGFKFLDAFLGLAKDRYDAPVEMLDFKKSVEPSRVHINQWVEKQTRDKIKDLLQPTIIGPDTRLVLVNAIYFKGSWEKAFDKKATRPAPFTSGGKTFDVPTMVQKQLAGFAEHDGVQVLSLPYKSGTGARLSMLVLLPAKPDGLPALESTLATKGVGDWIKDLQKHEVQVFLPKFKLESSLSLKDNLGALGMKSAFDCSPHTTADFSGMDGARDLCISAVVHKAFVDVNEEGTEAAAATAVVVIRASAVMQTPVFRADHPFILAIVDDASKSILFMGRVNDPRG
jgi:serpin B